MTFCKKLIFYCLGVVSLVASNAALAQDDNDYVSVYGAFVTAVDIDFRTNSSVIGTDFDDGFGFGIALGNILGREGEANRLHLQTELNYRSNDVNSHMIGNASLGGATGQLESTSLMVNALMSFSEEKQFSPYLGGGLGLAQVEVSGFGANSLPNVLNDDGIVFAFQLIAGFGLDVSPRAEIFAEYRWFSTEDRNVKTSAATGSVSNQIDYETDNIVVGIRFKF